MGNTCKPMAVSFQCMTKFTTNKTNKQKKNPPAMWETQFDPQVGKIPQRTERGFPSGSARKESSCNVGRLGLIRGLGRYPG